MKKSAVLLETFLDGLDALVDGRGWGMKHQKANDELHRIIDTHAEILQALKDNHKHVGVHCLTCKIIKKAEGNQ